MRRLIINAILGIILLFLSNLVLADDIPINLLTVIICAIGGVIGWFVILIPYLFGVAFLEPFLRKGGRALFAGGAVDRQCRSPGSYKFLGFLASPLRGAIKIGFSR